MNIKTSSTHTAFNQCREKMDFLTLAVNTLVFEEGYLIRHMKGIVKMVAHIADRNGEILEQSFVGKLRYKLKPLPLDQSFSDFEHDRAKLLAAASITRYLIDQGLIKARDQVDKEYTDHGVVFRKHTYLLFNGSQEKLLLKGLEVESGVVNQKNIGVWKLPAAIKDFLGDISSMQFKLSDVANYELIMKGYSLKSDWGRKKDKHGRSLQEDPIVRKKRYKGMAECITGDVSRLPCFYLPMKFDGRGRLCYEFQLEGMRPQGKLWETLMIDRANPKVLSESAKDHLRHIIYVNLHGRVSLQKAVDNISFEDLQKCRSADPMKAETEADFGEAILLNKAVKALDDAKLGRPCSYMFGKDLTNSGLIMAAANFNSPEMMLAANLTAVGTVMDSHTEFGKNYDLKLSRKDIKQIHMGLMHGETVGSIASKLSEVLDKDVTPEEVMAYNKSAYGMAVHNIETVADWGTKVVSNKQHQVSWRMPDGFLASHKAVMVGVPLMVYAPSAQHKEGYTGYQLESDMPLVTVNGFPIYNSKTEFKGKSHPVQVKNRGLYANITHSLDSYLLREVVRELVKLDEPFLLKHDDYMVSPDMYDTIVKVSQKVLTGFNENNMYQVAMEAIAAHAEFPIPVPTLIRGDADVDLSAAVNYLMP